MTAWLMLIAHLVILVVISFRVKKKARRLEKEKSHLSVELSKVHSENVILSSMIDDVCATNETLTEEIERLKCDQTK